MTDQQSLDDLRGRVHALGEILAVLADQFLAPAGSEEREILVGELETLMRRGFVDSPESVRGAYVETYRALLRQLKA